MQKAIESRLENLAQAETRLLRMVDDQLKLIHILVGKLGGKVVITQHELQARADRTTLKRDIHEESGSLIYEVINE